MPGGNGETELEVRVQGMTCQHCVAAVTSAVGAVPGVEDVTVDLETGLVRVHGHAGSALSEQVADAVRAAGYSVDTQTGREQS